MSGMSGMSGMSVQSAPILKRLKHCPVDPLRASQLPSSVAVRFGPGSEGKKSRLHRLHTWQTFHLVKLESRRRRTKGSVVGEE